MCLQWRVSFSIYSGLQLSTYSTWGNCKCLNVDLLSGWKTERWLKLKWNIFPKITLVLRTFSDYITVEMFSYLNRAIFLVLIFCHVSCNYSNYSPKATTWQNNHRLEIPTASWIEFEFNGTVVFHNVNSECFCKIEKWTSSVIEAFKLNVPYHEKHVFSGPYIYKLFRPEPAKANKSCMVSAAHSLVKRHSYRLFRFSSFRYVMTEVISLGRPPLCYERRSPRGGRSSLRWSSVCQVVR